MHFIPLQAGLFRAVEDFANLSHIVSSGEVEALFRKALPRVIPYLGFEGLDALKRVLPHQRFLLPGAPPGVAIADFGIRETTVENCLGQQDLLRDRLARLASTGEIKAAVLQEVTELVKDGEEFVWKTLPFFDGERFGTVTQIELHSIRAACLLAIGQISEYDLAHRIGYCGLGECSNFVLDVSARGRKARNWCSNLQGSRARQRLLRERRHAKGSNR